MPRRPRSRARGAAAVAPLLALWGLLLGAPQSLAAQAALGRLSGVVVDPSGAALPAAAIIARNQETGVELYAESNAAGGYVIADVTPGLYTLEIAADGFRRTALTGLKVDVGRTTAVPPVTLQLGDFSDTIEVSGAAPQVQTANAELTAVITTDQLMKLPLIGRDPLSFMRLQAGVTLGGRTPTTINGMRTSFANVTLDGINIQDNYIRANALDFLASRTLLDQVAEFSVTTQNGSSAVGGGASQVSFSTRSGGPETHGALYWHNRNDALAASDFFSNRQGLPKPFLNQNFFGVSVGGPLVRNKLFYFINYEGRRSRQQTLANATILTPDARRGVFTYLDQNDNLRKVNVLALQGVGVDPAIVRILGAVPGPDAINNFDVGDSDAGQLLNTAGYRYLTRSDGDRDALTSRLDWAPGDNHLFTGTYKFSREDTQRPGLGNGFHAVPVLEDYGRTNFLALAWRAAPGPRWSNELRGGFNLAPGDFRTTEQTGDALISGLLFTNPTVNFQPQGRDTSTYNFKNNTAAQLGRHSLRFGADWQMIRVETFDESGLLPTLQLGLDIESQYSLSSSFFPGGIDSDDLGRAEALLASLAGIVGRASRTFNVRDAASGYVPAAEYRRRYRYDNFALYLQDDLRLSPRLTLNLGLRWDYFGRFDERDGLMLSPIEGPGGLIASLLSDTELALAGGANGRPLWSPDRNNFAPHIGLAWDVFGDGSTAIRAGYSVNYVNDEIMQAAENAVSANDGLQGSVLLQNLDRFLSQGVPAIEEPTLEVPRRVSRNQALDPSAAAFAVDPRLRTPYVQQWNLSLQRAVSPNTVVEARYVGNKGTKLIRGFDYNQVILEENGFLDDFYRAQRNGFSALERTGEFNPAFNGAVPGSEPLFLFPQLREGGFLTSTLVREMIRRGESGALAELYIFNEATEGTNLSFRPNQKALVSDIITNYSNSSYHALQLELRRRIASGIQYQANYTFSKVLTDSAGTQVRFDPFLDIDQPSLERARADFDINHVFNANFVWQIPWGSNRWTSGWTLASIANWQSGAPISILSQRATINRPNRSAENTATTNLNKEELEPIVGFRMTGDGPFFIAQSAINPRDNSGVSPDGEQPFSGQAFFHPTAGAAGTLQRRLFSGPSSLAFDMSLSKTTRIAESQTVELGVNVENVLNHPTFFAGDQAIDSEQFGRITSTLTSPRRIEIKLRYQF